MMSYSDRHQVNVGWGREITIAELVGVLADVVGYDCEVRYNADCPDGTPCKLLDVGKVRNLGWELSIRLRQDLVRAHAGRVENAAEMT